MWAGFRRVLISASLLTLAATAVLAMPSVAARANGRVVDFERKVAGPYEIALGTIPGTPVVGSLHLTMTISEAATQTLILNADVTVEGKGPDSAGIDVGPLVALPNPADPAFRDINTSVDRIGAWTFTVSVSADQGDASADFAIDVRETSPLAGIIVLCVLLALVTVLGLAIRSYLRERGKSRRRRA